MKGIRTVSSELLDHSQEKNGRKVGHRKGSTSVHNLLLNIDF